MEHISVCFFFVLFLFFPSNLTCQSHRSDFDSLIHLAASGRLHFQTGFTKLFCTSTGVSLKQRLLLLVLLRLALPLLPRSFYECLIDFSPYNFT